MPSEPLDAAIIYATVGDLVPMALRQCKGRPRRLRGNPLWSITINMVVGDDRLISDR
jgi:hypothetical protein